MPIESVALGKSGLRIPPLGIGTWAWGDRFYWGYGQGYTKADLEASFKTSLAAGVNFFDTAEIYGRGRSESILGSFIKDWDGHVLVATKFMPYPWRWWRRRSLLTALRASLDRLGVAQVDLYQVHWPLPPFSLDMWANALADVVEAGLARAVGVSNYNPSQMRRAYEVLARRDVPLASNQVEFSLMHRGPEYSGLLAACRDMDVTLIAYSPLAQGVLTGKYSPETPPPGIRRLRKRRAYLARAQPIVALLGEIGKAYGDKTPAQVALNWVIRKGAVPIPGTKNAQHAEEDVGALGWRLTDDEVAQLDEVSGVRKRKPV